MGSAPLCSILPGNGSSSLSFQTVLLGIETLSGGTGQIPPSREAGGGWAAGTGRCPQPCDLGQGPQDLRAQSSPCTDWGAHSLPPHSQPCAEAQGLACSDAGRGVDPAAGGRAALTSRGPSLAGGLGERGGPGRGWGERAGWWATRRSA